jgi:biopolymer transport protein ExbB
MRANLSLKPIFLKPKNVIVFICIFNIAFGCFTAHAEIDVQKTILERIIKSKAELSIVEKDIANQNSQLTQKLDEQQLAIKRLREKASGLQRLADERLLGIDKIQERIKQWSNQSQFQYQLLSSYAESSDLLKTDSDIEISIDIAELAYQHLLLSLSPRWQQQDVISTKGNIDSLALLRIGPVEVARDQDQAGLISREVNNEARLLSGMYDETAIQRLGTLQATGVGEITFDPTLGNANKLLKQDRGLLAHIEAGGVWVFPILIFAALSFIVSVFKATQLLLLPTFIPLLAEKIAALEIATHLSPDERQQQLKTYINQCKGAQFKLMQISAETPVSQQRDDYLVAFLLEYKHKIEKYLGVIATSAAIAPLLGLLGTVSGMISTFKMMKIFGTGDASTVSGGISEALITTELGLIVAIPSLILSALLSRKVRSYHAQLETLAIKLSKIDFNTLEKQP